MAGIFNASIFNNSVFNTGDSAPADTPAAPRPGDNGRSIFKPLGLPLGKPKRRTSVDDRVEQSRKLEAEIAERLAREFEDDTRRENERADAQHILEMSMEEIDREIGILLRKKMRTQEDEILLLFLMVAATA